MANNMKRESLERELFNMKMRCHEYELRLQEVNLHGATGASLQAQNQELLQRVGALETECECQQAESDSLREICIKTRDAMLELQNKIEDLTGQNEMCAQENKSLREKNESLQKDRDSLTIKYTEACALFKEEESRLKNRIEDAERESSRWKNASERLQIENTSQKRALDSGERKISEQQIELQRLGVVEQSHGALLSEMKQTKVTLEKTMKDRDAQHAQVRQLTKSNEQLLADLESTKQEAKLASERTIALEGERLQIQAEADRRNLDAQLAQLERTVELTKEQSASKTLEYERVKLRNETLSKDAASLTRQLARLRAEMDNANEHERMKVQQSRDELQSEMDIVRRQMDSELDHQRAELRARLCEKEDLVVNLQARIRQLKMDTNTRVAQVEHQMEKLREEKHRIQTKWNASITAKRRVEAVRNAGTGGGTAGRPTRARSVGPRVRPSSVVSRRGVSPAATSRDTQVSSRRLVNASNPNLTRDIQRHEDSGETNALTSTSTASTTTPQRVHASKQRTPRSTGTKKRVKSSSKKEKKTPKRNQVRSPSPLVASPTRTSSSSSSQCDPDPQPPSRRADLASLRAARKPRQPFGVHVDTETGTLPTKGVSMSNSNNRENIENNRLNPVNYDKHVNTEKPKQTSVESMAKKAQMYLPVKARAMCSSHTTTSGVRPRGTSNAKGMRPGRLRDPALTGVNRRRALSSNASLRPSAMR